MKQQYGVLIREATDKEKSVGRICGNCSKVITQDNEHDDGTVYLCDHHKCIVSDVETCAGFDALPTEQQESGT